MTGRIRAVVASVVVGYVGATAVPVAAAPVPVADARVGAASAGAVSIGTASVRLPIPRPPRVPGIMVLGDSIALDMGPAVRSEAAALGYRPHSAAVIGCVAGGSVMWAYPDLVRDCFLFRAGWSERVRRDRPDVVILMRQALMTPGGQVPGASVCDPTHLRWFRARLREDVDALSVAGATVVLTTAPYSRWADTADEAADRDVDCANSAIREVARTQPDAALVDLASWVCPTRSCRTHHEGAVLRPDGVHFRDAGARVTMRHLYGQIYK